jgi:hypothetical protein
VQYTCLIRNTVPVTRSRTLLTAHWSLLGRHCRKAMSRQMRGTYALRTYSKCPYWSQVPQCRLSTDFNNIQHRTADTHSHRTSRSGLPFRYPPRHFPTWDSVQCTCVRVYKGTELSRCMHAKLSGAVALANCPTCTCRAVRAFSRSSRFKPTSGSAIAAATPPTPTQKACGHAECGSSRPPVDDGGAGSPYGGLHSDAGRSAPHDETLS